VANEKSEKSYQNLEKLKLYIKKKEKEWIKQEIQKNRSDQIRSDQIGNKCFFSSQLCILHVKPRGIVDARGRDAQEKSVRNLTRKIRKVCSVRRRMFDRAHVVLLLLVRIN